MIPPFAELTTKETVRQAAIWQLVGLVILVAHVLLVKAAIWLFPVSILILAVVYERAPLSGLLLYFQFLLYQNVIVSIFTPGMDRMTYTALLGTNFLALFVIAGLALLRIIGSRAWTAQYGSLLTAIKIALVLGVLYTAYGAAREGITSAAVYLREAESLVLMVLVGLDVGRLWGFKTVGIGFLTSAMLSIALTVTEVMIPIPYYDAVHAAEYSNLKLYDSFFDKGSSGPLYSGQQVEQEQEPVFFNITGDTSSSLKSYRFIGSIMHSISDAYVLADLALISILVGAWGWCVLLLPLMLLSGVKGANILFYCTMLSWAVWRSTRSREMLFACGASLILAYVAGGLMFGLASGDFHVIGFLGGIHGFMANPLGHGIGAGGNFSPQATEHGVNWQQLQHTMDANFALESAVGVLLYQMGIASLSIFAIAWFLIRKAPFTPRKPKRSDLVFIALAMVMANGIFQEEAYTPYAAGMFTLLAAVVVANGYRSHAVLIPRRARDLLPAFKVAGQAVAGD